MLKRYLAYLARWQLSTPILAVCIGTFAAWGNVMATVMANLIGGLIFFWIDRCIFAQRGRDTLWEIKSSVACADCGRRARGYRLVRAPGYDRQKDPAPQYRCEPCSVRKLAALEQQGVAAT